MNEQEKLNRPGEEIDLFYLLRPVSQGIKKAAAWFSIYIRNLRSNAWIFISLLVFSALIAFSIRYVLPKGYKSEAIFSSRSLNSDFCSLLINNLNEATSKNDGTQLLAGQLNIKPITAGDIRSMDAIPLTDTFYSYKKDSGVSLFKVVLVVYKTDAVPEIQSGIVNFLENNQYALKRKEARRKSLNALNEDFKLKLASLDSLKKIVNNSITPRSTGQGIILGEPVDPLGVYETESDYYNDILKNNEELEITSNIEVLQPFLLPDHFNYPNFKKLFLYIMAAGFLAALLFTPGLGRKRTHP